MKTSRPENAAIHEDFRNPTRSLGLKGHVVFTLRTKIHPESVEAVYDRLRCHQVYPLKLHSLFSQKKSCGGNPMVNKPLIIEDLFLGGSFRGGGVRLTSYLKIMGFEFLYFLPIGAFSGDGID